MKKVLLASTALVAFAGAAAADDNPNISISGSAEMGISGGSTKIDLAGGGNLDSDSPAQFRQNVDITFGMSGETDGGLAFGVSVDLDEAPGIANTELDDQGVAVFIQGEFGTLTMGDTDGALDKVLTEAGNVGNPGSIDDSETEHGGYLGSYADGIGSGDGQIVRYDYTFDAFEFALSVEQQDTAGGAVQDGADDVNWAIGFKYTFDFSGGSVALGLGYQSAGDAGSSSATSTSVSVDGGAAVVTNSAESGLPFGLDDGIPVFDGLDVRSSAVSTDIVTDTVTVPVVDATGAVVAQTTTTTTSTTTLDFGGVNVIGLSATANLDSGLSVGIQYSSWDFDNINENASHIGIGAGYTFDAFSVHANYGQFKLDNVSITGFGLAAAYDLGGGAQLKFGYGNTSSDDFDFNNDGDADDYSASTYSLGLTFSF